MSLLIFSYLLAAFLFAFSYFLDSRSEKLSSMYTSMTMTAAFIALFAGLSAQFMYTGNLTVGNLTFRLTLICLSFLTLTLLRYSVAIPYNNKNMFLTILIWVFEVIAVYIVFIRGVSLELNYSGKFVITSGLHIGTLTSLRIFAFVFLYGIPGITVFSLITRGISIRSRIYQQRLFLVALSICVGFIVSWSLFRLSVSYSWALPLFPLGLAVMLILVYQSVSVTTIFDRTQLVPSLVNFLVLNVVFSFLAALFSATIIRFIPIKIVIIIALVLVAVVLLILRSRASEILHKYVRIGTEYQAELEKELDSLDFSSGGNEVITKTVDLLSEYVECSSVDILVSDDKGKLVTVFSSKDIKAEISIENKGIAFLLNQNASILLKTQAITHHLYSEVKTDLLKVFDTVNADAMILLREGHRVVGLLLLGPKKRGADYTDYDYSVLSKLYSNFFLVMYYLKNIAQESVVLTVDREIEFSGQVISSIQENIDRIDHPKVDVDFITQSARKLGGDFIDFIKLSDDKYLYVMGDVSGKGLNASMSMVILKSVLRTFLSETKDFKQLVIKVNLFIKNNLPKGTFFAGVFGIIDFTQNTMFYINCGVPTMFLYTAAYNNAIEIQGDGKVLGFVKDIGKYLKVKKIGLNSQDIILLTTDGLIDSTNLRGERFGKDRVQRLLMDNRSYPAGRMAQFLCENVEDFVATELEDDITVLVFKYLSK
ncbi:MAG TPA: PP2C family protein-serine/threonine phosphatase [Treponemataceae bacterium]|nr:PP2C family protein-serine/threonine phosphatase [Treponemataceae bacterium]